MDLPDIDEMPLDTLQEYAKRLREALMPFAHAGIRCNYFGIPEDGEHLCVLVADTIFELLVNDPDVIDGVEEDCRSLEVADLKVAVLAINHERKE